MASKRKTSRQEKRAQKKASKKLAMERGDDSNRGHSRYAKKGRKKEIRQGYSTRPTSPFYLAESQRGGEVQEAA